MIEGAGKVDRIIVGLVLAIDLVSVATLSADSVVISRGETWNLLAASPEQ
ncbi:hypothetical protein [Aeromonas veronii]|nr:hypothetical protein [Aeromonas veronii]MBL0643851.1 hypothetical protein [Aeromonas veronii]